MEMKANPSWEVYIAADSCVVPTKILKTRRKGNRGR
jgi:hypothetical protein